jgi:hypothetical protein
MALQPCSSMELRTLPSLDRVIVGLELLLSVGALFGGAVLVAGPDGHLLGMPQSLLASSPFTSFLIPGLLLFVASVLTMFRSRAAPFVTFAAGAAVVGWITVEMVMLAGFGSLAWAAYLVLGTSIAALGVAAVRNR